MASSTERPPVHLIVRVGQRFPKVSEAFRRASAPASLNEEKMTPRFDTRPMPSYDTSSPPSQLIERLSFMFSWARKTTLFLRSGLQQKSPMRCAASAKLPTEYGD